MTTRLSAADAERARTWHVEICQVLLPGVAVRNEGRELRFMHQGGFTIRKSDSAWYSHNDCTGGYWTVPLVKFLKKSYSHDDAVTWIADWLKNPDHAGVGSCDGADDSEDTTAPISADEAKRILAEAVDIHGTPAAAYLESRRLDPPFPGDLRYLADARCGEGALVAPLYAHDRIVGCQILYLDPDGRKSLISPLRRRFMLEKSPEATFLMPYAGENTEIVVCEGLEDAISVWHYGTLRCRVIGLPGIGSLRHQRFPKGIKVTVVPDGDPAGSPARKALEAGLDALILQDLDVHVAAIPPHGWDANQVLVEYGVEELQDFIGSAAPAALSLDGEVERISRLSGFDFDIARKDFLATHPGIRAATFDDAVKKARQRAATARDDDWVDIGATRPWPDPVDGAELLDELSATIGKFVIMGDAECWACALWVVFSYCLAATAVAPKLWIKSAERRSGKTRLLDLLAVLVYRPFVAGYITPAALVRIIEERKPTVLLDEIDTFIQNNDRLRGILDNGFDRGKPAVLCIGDDNKPGEFDIFCPQVLAGIGDISDTVADRSIRIELERKPPSVQVSRLRRRDTAPLVELSQKCTRWAADNLAELSAAIDGGTCPEAPREVYNDRAADAWEILLTIAAIASGHWVERAQRAAIKLSDSDDRDDESVGISLLHDIRLVFVETLQKGGNPCEQCIASTELAQRLRNIEGALWAEYGRSGGLTPNRLARLLRPFHITPAKHRIGKLKLPLQGYARRQLESAFARYLKPLPPDPPEPSHGVDRDYANSTGAPEQHEDFRGFGPNFEPEPFRNSPEFTVEPEQPEPFRNGSDLENLENPSVSAVCSTAPVETTENGEIREGAPGEWIEAAQPKSKAERSEKIRQLRAAGWSFRKIGREFGISHAAVQKIVRDA